MKLANNFEDVLKALNLHHVDFIIVGGYAVIFHGYGRTTGDLDIWVNPIEGNKRKLINAFTDLDYDKRLLDYLHSTDFSKPFAIKLGDEPIQLDIFNAITGVSYEIAAPNSISFKFSEELEARFINLPELIINKMLSGRLKDQADVEELQRISKYKS
jgi:predicted nucleotidyltransferase